MATRNRDADVIFTEVGLGCDMDIGISLNTGYGLRLFPKSSLFSIIIQQS